MIAQSQSGTGKTAAFALTILSRINYDLHAPQVTTTLALLITQKTIEGWSKGAPAWSATKVMTRRLNNCTTPFLLGFGFVAFA
jgi:hypothetical protein